jgi:hypothetical protein
MPANFVLLERTELNASAASVTFANIPQTGYTDLKVVLSTRTTDTTANDSTAIALQFNGDTASNYSRRSLVGDGASATSTNATTTSMRIGFTTTNGCTANTFGNGEFYVPNYTGSTQKSVSADAVAENNSTTFIYSALNAGLWTGTAAITSITVLTPSFSFLANSTFSLYGLAALGTTPVIAPKASGGNRIDYDGTYWIHTFNTNGTFTPQTALSCDYLVVAGGGGGGTRGGGGAGGFRTATAQSLTTTAYTVTVGAGAAINANGSDSIFDIITSTGGGKGATSTNAGNGGSGGGGYDDSVTNFTAGTGNTPSTSPSQGNNGGAGGGATRYTGGGGGGASATGGAGQSGSGTLLGGAGGAGTASSISGSSVTYAGGGGGGGDTGGAGGAGGGGTGATSATDTATAGGTNLGGGGGAGRSGAGVPKAGGSGVVIIRYLA